MRHTDTYCVLQSIYNFTMKCQIRVEGKVGTVHLQMFQVLPGKQSLFSGYIIVNI